MSKVVLPFMSDESRTQGDSSIPVEFTIPYQEGMTVEELDHQVVFALTDNWGDPGFTVPPLKEMRDEAFGVDQNDNSVYVAGGFVIDEELYNKIINSSTGLPMNDSAAYWMCHTLKSVIAAFAEKVIE